MTKESCIKIFRVKTEPEDPPIQLPVSDLLQFRKGDIIYNQHHPSSSVYMVIDGTVKVSRVAATGRDAIVDIYQPKEFFGESAFLNLPHCPEQARALENARVMAWSVSFLTELVLRRPSLGVALIQLLAQRTTSLTERVASLSKDRTIRRLARCTHRSLVRRRDARPVSPTKSLLSTFPSGSWIWPRPGKAT